MNITFTKDMRGKQQIHQARAEQTFSMGGGHGDACLTGYGETKDEALDNLKQLALRMVRELDTMKGL